MNSSFLNILILLGALQGFIVMTLLLTVSSKLRKANVYLAMLILIISVASLGVFLMQIGIKYQSDFWMIISQVIPFFVAMPIGPLIYFYIRKTITPNVTLTKWHFSSIVIDLFPHVLITLALLFVPGKVNAINDFNDAYQTYADIPRWMGATVYLIFAFRLLRTEIELAKNDRKVIWLKQFVAIFLCFQLIWFIHLVPYIIPSLRDTLLDQVGWYPVYIPLTFLIYWLGMKGLIVSFREVDRQPSSSALLLTPERRSMIISRLKTAMEHDRLFLDPTLSLTRVAEHIGIPQKQISAVINQLESKTFNEFINVYRIEEFKNLSRNGEVSHLTLFGLALECGFNSQPTFQRAFKSKEGISPSEYCSKVRQGAKISA